MYPVKASKPASGPCERDPTIIYNEVLCWAGLDQKESPGVVILSLFGKTRDKI